MKTKKPLVSVKSEHVQVKSQWVQPISELNTTLATSKKLAKERHAKFNQPIVIMKNNKIVFE